MYEIETIKIKNDDEIKNDDDKCIEIMIINDSITNDDDYNHNDNDIDVIIIYL